MEPPKVLKNKKAGGEATFKPTSWARQRAWRVKSLRLVGARSDNKLYFVAAPALWIFGGTA